jgi:MYXO-CTERM domain-containing protein
MRLAATAALVLAGAGSARAEIQLTSPQPRTFAEQNGPCGTPARSTIATTFFAGEQIFVEWDETIDRPGHYRIAFDADGVDDLDSPAATLVDNIPDMAGGHYKIAVTLPPVTCTSCTLQIVQVADDTESYQCADLELVAGEWEACGGGPATTMCCSTGSGGAGGLLAVVGILLRRRQRRLRG